MPTEVEAEAEEEKRETTSATLCVDLYQCHYDLSSFVVVVVVVVVLSDRLAARIMIHESSQRQADRSINCSRPSRLICWRGYKRGRGERGRKNGLEMETIARSPLLLQPPTIASSIIIIVLCCSCLSVRI